MSTITNQSSISRFFEPALIPEANFQQVNQLSKNLEFNAKLDNLVDAQTELNDSKALVGQRNKVIKKRALLVILAITSLIAMPFLLAAATPVALALTPVCIPLALLAAVK